MIANPDWSGWEYRKDHGYAAAVALLARPSRIRWLATVEGRRKTIEGWMARHGVRRTKRAREYVGAVSPAKLRQVRRLHRKIINAHLDALSALRWGNVDLRNP